MKSWCCSVDREGAPHKGALHEPAPPEAGFIWCHLDGRAEEERRWLEEKSGLPHGVISALVAVETRPRSETFGAGALVNLRGLGTRHTDDPDPLVSIRLWAEKGRVISVSYRTLAATEEASERMAAGEIKDPGDLIAALAVMITEKLDPEIAMLGDMTDDCEAQLDADLAPDRSWAMRRRIARARSEAISYRRFVVPQRQALERLAALECSWLEEDDRMHLREAADRFARMGEELEAVRERSALLHEQLTDLRAELTETRTLVISVVALVFLPLTFITGLFGINYPFPFEQAHWPFWAILGFCLVTAVAITGYFMKARWFRR